MQKFNERVRTVTIEEEFDVTIQEMNEIYENVSNADIFDLIYYLYRLGHSRGQEQIINQERKMKNG